LLERVSILFATETVEAWRGCLVVATDSKVRVKRSNENQPTRDT